MFFDVDWSHHGDYVLAKHGVSTQEADEALQDPVRLVIQPDPASLSGRSVRIIGWSHTADAVLTVIVVEDDGREYGVNAWHANGRDARLYRKEENS